MLALPAESEISMSFTFFKLCIVLIYGMVAGAVFVTLLRRPEPLEGFFMPPNQDREKPLQRWSWRWSRTVYTVGFTYFDAWNYRGWETDQHGSERIGLGQYTHAVRCLEVGFFWWELKFFWLAKLPPSTAWK